MLSLLPDHADPWRLCALGKAYEGEIALAELPRLAPLLASEEGEAAFSLAFDRDADGRPRVRVHVRASLPVQCQRCLGAVQIEVDADSTLVLVSGPDEAERLPDEFDPLLVEDQSLALSSLIEDELILAIPAAPVHPVETCAVKLDDINAPEAQPEESAGEAANNPFAALANWKNDDESRD